MQLQGSVKNVIVKTSKLMACYYTYGFIDIYQLGII